MLKLNATTCTFVDGFNKMYNIVFFTLGISNLKELDYSISNLKTGLKQFENMGTTIILHTCHGTQRTYFKCYSNTRFSATNARNCSLPFAVY